MDYDMEIRSTSQGFLLWGSLIVLFWLVMSLLHVTSLWKHGILISDNQSISYGELLWWGRHPAGLRGRHQCGRNHCFWIPQKRQMLWVAFWHSLLRRAWEVGITIPGLYKWKLRFKLNHRATREAIWNLNPVMSKFKVQAAEGSIVPRTV